jgi:hypothetical protein
MAKNQNTMEKRRREMEKRRKAEEKRVKRNDRKDEPAGAPGIRIAEQDITGTVRPME